MNGAKTIRAREFTAERAWGALDIANMRGITTYLHWTSDAYIWHVNDGSGHACEHRSVCVAAT